MTNTLHADELAVDENLVRKLVAAQFPVHAGLDVHRLDASGSTNALFRLGDELLVRLPRQPGGSAAIEKEARWMPIVSPALGVAVPEIVAVGDPGLGYPERWSVARWLDGELPLANEPGRAAEREQMQLAEDLADVIVRLRWVEVSREAAEDPTLRWYRGRALSEFDRPTRANIEACRSIEGFDLDLERVETIWDDALQLPGAHEASADCWYHSDLVAENLLMQHGRLTAVLDFGCLSVGDPTIDLHGAWELFGPAARDVFRNRLGIDESEWLRGRAWALAIALGCFSYYWHTMPSRRRDRLAMARAVLAEVSDG